MGLFNSKVLVEGWEAGENDRGAFSEPQRPIQYGGKEPERVC